MVAAGSPRAHACEQRKATLRLDVMPERKLLGQILMETAGVSDQDVQKALRLGEQKKIKIGQALIQIGAGDEPPVARALARQFALPFVDLSKSKLPESVTSLLPLEVVRQFRVIPVKKEP